MKTIGALLAFISVSIVVAGSDLTPRDENSEKRPADLIWFHQEALPADISVLEGLPHPHWEPGLTRNGLVVFDQENV